MINIQIMNIKFLFSGTCMRIKDKLNMMKEKEKQNIVQIF